MLLQSIKLNILIFIFQKNIVINITIFFRNFYFVFCRFSNWLLQLKLYTYVNVKLISLTNHDESFSAMRALWVATHWCTSNVKRTKSIGWRWKPGSLFILHPISRNLFALDVHEWVTTQSTCITEKFIPRVVRGLDPSASTSYPFAENHSHDWIAPVDFLSEFRDCGNSDINAIPVGKHKPYAIPDSAVGESSTIRVKKPFA